MDRHSVCQLEIRVRDLAASVAYYDKAFGWRFEVMPAQGYALTRQPVGIAVGLQAVLPEVPLGTVPYLLTDDITRDTRRAQELGARLLMDETPSGDAGSWSHLVDPFGNELAFWQPRRRPPESGPADAPLVWLELRAPDLGAAVSFYKRVCGWNMQILPSVDDFAFLAEPHRQVGIGLVGGPRADLLARATPYVRVAELSAALARVRAAGGRTSEDEVGGPVAGRFRMSWDPDGTPLGLFTEAPRQP